MKNTIIREKKNVLKNIKLITKYITSTRTNDDILKILNDDNKNHLMYISKIYNLLAIFPKIISYIDKYFNNKYSNFKFTDILKSIVIILHKNDIKNKNQLYYGKKIFNNNRLKFKKTLHENHRLSENEIYNLYKLYLKKTNIIVQYNNEEIKPKKMINNEINIGDFITKICSYIDNREVCKKCSMYDNRTKAILDANFETICNVDICFQGLNPGKNEHEQNNVFVGPSGKLLRPYINKLCNKYDLKYIITNTILCWSSSSSDIVGINNVIKNCKHLNNIIHKCFNPKITVLLGQDALTSYGIKDKISVVNGTLINENIFAIYHPSYILKDREKRVPEFEDAFDNLENIIKKKLNINNNENNDNIINDCPINYHEKYPKVSKNIIESFNNNYLLVDIFTINDDVVFTLSEKETGHKYYVIRPVKFECFIKSGSHIDCDFMTKNVDGVLYLSTEEKSLLNKKLYYKLHEKINI